MSKTPTKSFSKIDCFTPSKELETSNKDLPGLPKTVFTHISTLQKLLCEWKAITYSATKQCQIISNLKRPKLHDEDECDKFPKELGPPVDNLMLALDNLSSIVDGVSNINRQLSAVAKIQPQGTPVILTWTAKQISENVSKIFASIQKEYQVKKIITENIAHTTDKNLLDTYLCAWNMDPYFNMESTAYLFIEVRYRFYELCGQPIATSAYQSCELFHLSWFSYGLLHYLLDHLGKHQARTSP